VHPVLRIRRCSDRPLSVLPAVQPLWINIIMDTFAGLALATNPASRSPLGRKPDTHRTRLSTPGMIKVIPGQSIYQIIAILVFHFLFFFFLVPVYCVGTVVSMLHIFHFLGNDILGYDHSAIRLFLVFQSVLTLTMVFRNWYSDPHHVRRWCCLPSLLLGDYDEAEGS